MHGVNDMNNHLPGFAAMLALSVAQLGRSTPRKSWIDEIDIDHEYELIQQKKSKLSRSKRDAVVRSYNRKSFKN